MAILDHELTMSDQQVLTATAISTKVIDLGPFGGFPTANAFRDIATGRPLFLHVNVDVTLDSAAEGATLVVQLESDDNDTLSSSPTVHWTSASIAEAALGAGYEIKVALPPGEYQQYLGLRYTVGGENFTTGKISARITPEIEVNRQYRGAVKNTAS